MDEQVRREALFWLGDRGEPAPVGAASAGARAATGHRRHPRRGTEPAAHGAGRGRGSGRPGGGRWRRR